MTLVADVSEEKGDDKVKQAKVGTKTKLKGQTDDKKCISPSETVMEDEIQVEEDQQMERYI